MLKKGRLGRLAALVALSLGALGASAALAADAGVHVDQVGYLTNYPKVAIVTDDGGTEFTVVDAKTKAEVFRGTLSAAVSDKASGEKVREADFSALNTPGDYILYAGKRDSYEFAIGDNVYAPSMVRSWRSYTVVRSTPHDDSAVTGLNVREGHEAADMKAALYFTDEQNKKGDRLDVSGGWYDAGDYGKYVSSASAAAAQLMLSYETKPEAFTEGQLLFPAGVEGQAGVPDALTEVRYELDFLLKMQRPDGTFFHKVAGSSWPGMDFGPDSDRQPRFIYGTASYASAATAATLAMGARIFQPYDFDYAVRLLAAAQRTYNYLAAHQEPFYRFDEGQDSASGPYNKDGDLEERVWLAAELFKTTGRTEYEDELKGHLKKTLLGGVGTFYWGNFLSLGQYAYATAYGADEALQGRVRDNFLRYADGVVETIRKDGYHCSLKESEYEWGSTKNALLKGDMLLLANAISPKAEYVEGALEQIHYLFGRNSLNKSFLLGEGDNPPMHPHDRIHEGTGVMVPGRLVGGPNKYLMPKGDPDQSAYLMKHPGTPVAKSYIDTLMSWSTNETAIDYTSAASQALSYFSRPEAFTAEDIKLTRDFPKIKPGYWSLPEGER